jgi:hypothetical protein
VLEIFQRARWKQVRNGGYSVNIIISQIKTSERKEDRKRRKEMEKEKNERKDKNK